MRGLPCTQTAGEALIVLRSTIASGMSAIRVRLTEGSLLTTLVAIAHPEHRDVREAEPRTAGVWR